ncbi:MAG: hypothetical protein GY758_28240 [Fuerstiella sp.]|nr:hypothetical protein [Fuerstiella sp.]
MIRCYGFLLDHKWFTGFTSELQSKSCDTFTAGLKSVQHVVEQIATNVLHGLQIQCAIIG